MIGNQEDAGGPGRSRNVNEINQTLTCEPISEIILNILPRFNGSPTNPKLLSSDIIWFWTPANIPWLDLVIDPARAVKVRPWLDSLRLTFTGNSWADSCLVSFYREHLQGLMFRDGTYVWFKKETASFIMPCILKGRSDSSLWLQTL